MVSGAAFQIPSNPELNFGGWIGSVISNVQRNWLIHLPATDPGIITMFEQRKQNAAFTADDLIAWSGEYAGKYLIGAIQFWRITKDEKLQEQFKDIANRLCNSQGPDGYLGPYSPDERMLNSDR